MIDQFTIFDYVAVTALARKLALLAWTLLDKQEVYQSQAVK